MLNSKIRPRAVVGYGVKIFLPSPPNYVTRSPGVNIHTLRLRKGVQKKNLGQRLTWGISYTLDSDLSGPRTTRPEPYHIVLTDDGLVI